MAEIQMHNKDGAAAKISLKKALEIEPQNLEVIALLGRLHMELNEIDEALSFFQQLPVEKLLADSADYTSPSSRNIIDAFVRKGRIYRDQGKLDAARDAYSQVLLIAGKHFEGCLHSQVDPEVKRLVEDATYLIAAITHKEGNIVGAILHYRRCLLKPVFEFSPSAQRRVLKKMGRMLVRQTAGEYIPLHSDPNSAYYIPRDCIEEGLLVLLLLEDNMHQLVLRDDHTISDRTLIAYDDIAIGLFKRGSYRKAVQIYERLLGHHYNDVYYWFQFALALYSARKYRRTLFVLKKCIDMTQNNFSYLLLAGKICVNFLHEFSLGIEYAQKAVEFGEISQAKAYHVLGVAYSKQSTKARTREERLELQKKALEALIKANEINPQDHLILLHLALQHAIVREIPAAFAAVKASLRLNETAEGWNLLALLLSSQKKLSEAVIICDTAFQNFQDENLIMTKAKLEKILKLRDVALETLKQATELWKKKDVYQQKRIYQEEDLTEQPTDLRSIESQSVKGDDAEMDKKSIIQHTMSVYSDDLEHSAEHVRGVGRVEVWVLAAQLFIELGQSKDVRECLQEARQISAFHPDILFSEGLLLEFQNSPAAAAEVYERVLCIDAGHVKSLIKLSNLAHAHGRDAVLAEKYLTSAVRLEPENYEVWELLGRLFSAKGEAQKAAECFSVAVDLEATAPILPYHKIEMVL
eukprot:TRINITY_DN4282_c0_g1_i2.p1 TRINITY_DN4282_c0_g1~~TRINITY_DN4282_c0_g1_i2.p1  ORF type:complete len:770 (+),score=246.60 TRINITY_DN4282_c0_g1_i2:223-2310(+)